MIGYLRREAGATLANVLNGCRTAVFRRRSFERYQVRVDQVVWLIGFNILLAIGVGYLTRLPDPEFYHYGFYTQAIGLSVTLFAAFVVSRMLGDERAATRLLVMLYSVAPIFFLATQLLASPEELGYSESVVDGSWAYLLLVLWGLAVSFFMMTALTGGANRGAVKVFVVYLAVTVIPAFNLADWEFWYPRSDESGADEYEVLYEEDALYRQYDLVDGWLGGLRGGIPNRPDVYYVGFGSYSDQDVFMKEVNYGQGLFETRFDAQGRTAVLINNLKTVNTAPMATKTNLAMVLNAIGDVMDRDEDVLFLYMTSHGSSDHELSVTMWPYTLDQIKPQELRTLLDESGIRNRVLMISACYSGGFVDALKDYDTLVITAAAADRKSFGCSNQSDFTYFGKALLDEHLPQDRPLIEAFENALDSIQARERRENKALSQPQLFVGPGIRARLSELDRVLVAGGDRDLDRAVDRAGRY
jgi:hypothetical protein